MADTATDYLTVRVGYRGMDLSDYATAGKYHWSELEGLGVYEYAYSYYQSGTGTEYTAIVDSARGVLVKDVLDYANIYFGDIYNLKFYVEDHHGIQASFDRDSLFCTRYYFDNFAYHLERIEDEDGNVTGYGYDEVWQYARSVPPMLALEDSWIGYSQEFYECGPNWESMNSSNRFRLLFGQTSPTETLTSASAKYVSCIYVTLYGSPSFGEMPELEKSLGAHEVTLQVRVDDESLMKALSEYMRLASTDENVMRIIGVTFSAVDGYSDLVNVTVSYEIVGEGEASLTASFGGTTEVKTVSQSVTVEPDTSETPDSPPEQTDSEEPAPSGEDPGPSGSATDPEGGTPGQPGGTEPRNDETSHDQTPSDGETHPSSQETPVRENDALGDNGKKERPRETEKVDETTPASLPEKTPEDVSEKIDEAEVVTAEEPEQATASVMGFRLSDRTASAIGAGEREEPALPWVPAAEDISQVKLEDPTEKNEERQKALLLWTGVGCAGLCALGAVTETAAFHMALDRKKARVRLISSRGSR